MEKIKLKPCPFCGGKATFVVKSNESSHYGAGFDFEVGCEKCKIVFPGRYKMRFTLSRNGELDILTDERKSAADKWNKRAGQEGDAHAQEP